MSKLLPADFQGEKYGLCYRFVNVNDAEFIVKLRTNPKLGRFINSTESDVEKQRKWIEEYKIREEKGLDYYFIFGLKDGTQLGVSRIYNIKEDAFETGSWVFDPAAPYGASFLGDIIVHEYAYNLFPEKKHLFSIEKGNDNVLKYSKLFNPQLIDETETSYFFQNDKENYLKASNKVVRRIMPVFLKATTAPDK